MCKVSVIVPVYNKEPYIGECLDSLLSQTLTDVEILCVDDKSTDNSLRIVSEYAARDARVRVIPLPENSGVSVARNVGIREATGEFIAFVDADDFVESDFYEKLYGASAGYDCVKGEIWDYDPEIGKCAVNTTCDLNDRIKQTGNPMCFYYGFTSAIYRKSFMDRYGFRFPEGLSYNEDPFFTVTVMTKLSEIKIVDGARYFYRIVPHSLSRSLTPEKATDFYRSVLGIFSYLNACDLTEESKYAVTSYILEMTSSLSAQKFLSDEQLHRLKQEYHSFLGKKKEIGAVKVSVIVPVYNGEKYLRRTLDCLTFQSLYDIEILCVNDRSTDGSLAILREYQKEDGRIKIIDCPVNGGESKARNIGIRAAIGEYIAFMDQDDRIDLLFYEKLYAKAMETRADIVKGDAIDILYNGDVIIKTCGPVKQNPLYFAGEWWTAIYKKSLIDDHHLELPEGWPLGGDMKFLFDACRVCNKVAVNHNVNYYHIMHADSGDSEVTPVPKIKSVIATFSYILNAIEEDNLCERDKDCYVYYYYSYMHHLVERIRRCREMEGKLLCSDFLFRCYEQCKCKKEALTKICAYNSALADILEKNRKSFFDSLLEKEVLSEVFYAERREEKPASVSCTVIVPYISQEVLDKYIIRNPFLREEERITYHFVDNKTQNKAISVVYNEFLDGYDYDKDAWFVFMHSDFEFCTYPSDILNKLDPSKIYGPVGTKAYVDRGKMYISVKGEVYEKDSLNTLYFNLNYKYNDLSVDTLDCMCLIVHSSLVKKYHLRFDEMTVLDLYVEDFCIQATKRHGIPVEALYFDCTHHSDYVSAKYYSQRYLAQLKYINAKYPDEIYGGTVTPVGGKILPMMTDKEFRIFLIRQEMKTGKKL